MFRRINKNMMIIIVLQFVLLVLYYNVPNNKEAYPRHETYEDENKSDKSASKYIFNCTNINSIRLFKYDIGGGMSKTIDIGTFERETVVVKRLSPRKNPKERDAQFREVLFMKDILMRDQLDHPSIIKMLGFCVNHLKHDLDIYQGYLPFGDISAVYEFGKEFRIAEAKFRIEERLNHALDIADLISYLHHSPLGSLKLVDFLPYDHFLMVKGKIKLIDLDYINNVEPTCYFSSGCSYYNITCQPLNSYEIQYTNCKSTNNCTIGVCRGTNLKHNMARFTESFFAHLLKPELYPLDKQKKLIQLLLRLDKHDIYIDDLLDELRGIKQTFPIFKENL
ncbi:protein O-mannose kinase-like [Mytilus trossulus]|uniref:protein O-mannose kinase-like n=1 Tax=Mytilus trossulus TaxID=6551 RepID=UPI0030062373